MNRRRYVLYADNAGIMTYVEAYADIMIAEQKARVIGRTRRTAVRTIDGSIPPTIEVEQ